MGKQQMPDPAAALKGRDRALEITGKHFVNGVSIKAPFPAGIELAYFGLGCFWGAERRFWQQRGVYATAVGYAGGYTPNPSYEEVCSGDTGHAEVVLVAFDPSVISYDDLLRVFWEVHDPTQGMRQGNDLGTQYRSVIFTTSDRQIERAQATFAAFQKGLKEAGKGAITTEIAPAPVFYYGEEYHQQYLAKNPAGYCGLAGTGVCLMPE
ncbi:peptide-methionine (S)-S-oxide reductase MsrA [Simiduia litorea]|uniref:peptide-methionine (S)-S-oxide reductase MsrA n=1 Tax=Simiduia litorea TaxID=1435348 RepID=UPI0036F3CE64